MLTFTVRVLLEGSCAIRAMAVDAPVKATSPEVQFVAVTVTNIPPTVILGRGPLSSVAVPVSTTLVGVIVGDSVSAAAAVYVIVSLGRRELSVG